MITLDAKYNVGDTVYNALAHMTQKKHPCPDCKGSRVWKAISPAGQEYSFACPRCESRYIGDKNVSLAYTAHEPMAQKLTIGSIRIDTADENDTVQYMCVETGVGSGTIYRESNLFPDYETALQVATMEATRMDSEIPWIVELYKGTLDLSDYQLSDARDKGAVNDAESRFEKVRYFADDIHDASTIEEVKEIYTKHFGESE